MSYDSITLYLKWNTHNAHMEPNLFFCMWLCYARTHIEWITKRFSALNFQCQGLIYSPSHILWEKTASIVKWCVVHKCLLEVCWTNSRIKWEMGFIFIQSQIKSLFNIVFAVNEIYVFVSTIPLTSLLLRLIKNITAVQWISVHMALLLIDML